MGICRAAEFCFFASSRTGSHSVHALLAARFGDDYRPFGRSDLLDRLGTDANAYIEWGGDHTCAGTIHRLLPEAQGYRSVSSFRDPLARVGSIYAYTSQLVGAATSLAGFDEWIRLVFCNRYNDVWKAHGLQVDVFSDQFGRPCVDRVYLLERLRDMVDYLVPGSGCDLPHVNSSNNCYKVGDLKLSTQRVLLDRIVPDLEFYDDLVASGGILVFK